ncbi:MAG: YhjD/YihY/BrkB family envelope integrity protein [Actinomycetota bacterium]
MAGSQTTFSTRLEDLKSTGLVSGVLAVRKRYAEDAADHLAASITYFGFLSLFPLLLLGLSAIGFVVGGDPALVQEWTQRLSAAIPGLAPLIRDSLAKVAENRGAAGVVGFAGLVWSASRASEAAGHALARIYRRTPIQGFLRKAIWSLGNTIALGLLALAGLVLAAGAGGYRAGGPPGSPSAAERRSWHSGSTSPSLPPVTGCSPGGPARASKAFGAGRSSERSGGSCSRSPAPGMR